MHAIHSLSLANTHTKISFLLDFVSLYLFYMCKYPRKYLLLRQVKATKHKTICKLFLFDRIFPFKKFGSADFSECFASEFVFKFVCMCACACVSEYPFPHAFERCFFMHSQILSQNECKQINKRHFDSIQEVGHRFANWTYTYKCYCNDVHVLCTIDWPDNNTAKVLFGMKAIRTHIHKQRLTLTQDILRNNMYTDTFWSPLKSFVHLEVFVVTYKNTTTESNNKKNNNHNTNKSYNKLYSCEFTN